MSSKSFTKVVFYTGLITVLSALLSLSKVSAASTDSVSATVTVQNISVSVSDGSVAYGTLSTSSTEDTTTNGINDSQTATNDGNITVDLDISGADTASWTLAATAGTDQYIHSFCTATCDTTPSWTALTTSYQSLATSVAASGTQEFDLQISTPTTSTSFTQQTATVTVLASAP